MVGLKFIFTNNFKKRVVDDLDKPNQSHHEPGAWDVKKEREMIHQEWNKPIHENMERVVVMIL